MTKKTEKLRAIITEAAEVAAHHAEIGNYKITLTRLREATAAAQEWERLEVGAVTGRSGQ